MPTFENEWISPILEVFKREKITGQYTIVLGLNPLGQAVCRSIYDERTFETVLVFNSPSFSTWNRYPAGLKAPVIPVHGMVNDDLMMIWGDIFVKDYEWVTDLLFYIRGNVPTRFILAFMSHDGPTCGVAISKKGNRLLDRMGVQPGYSDFYDGLIAPLMSVGQVAGLDPVVIFLEQYPGQEIIYQIDDIAVGNVDIERIREYLNSGLDLKLDD